MRETREHLERGRQVIATHGGERCMQLIKREFHP